MGGLPHRLLAASIDNEDAKAGDEQDGGADGMHMGHRQFRAGEGQQHHAEEDGQQHDLHHVLHRGHRMFQIGARITDVRQAEKGSLHGDATEGVADGQRWPAINGRGNRRGQTGQGCHQSQKYRACHCFAHAGAVGKPVCQPRQPGTYHQYQYACPDKNADVLPQGQLCCVHSSLLALVMPRWT